MSTTLKITPEVAEAFGAGIPTLVETPEVPSSEPSPTEPSPTEPSRPTRKGSFPPKTWGALMHYYRDLGQSEEEARASVAALDRDEGYTLAHRRRRQFGAVMAIERALGQPEDEAKARFNAMDV
ncbi:MAG: hypothetical protein HY722_04860, partial [Planctomycetes bacterium]|nr:hypothetical protein [Planctomycetota bacterium]